MTGSGRCIQRAVFACLLAVVSLSLILPAPGALAMQDGQARNDEGTLNVNPDEQTMGIYITSLRDFDTSGDSFGVDYWLWSVHPQRMDPLNKVEFVNAKQVDIRLDQNIERQGGAGRDRRSGPRCCKIGI